MFSRLTRSALTLLAAWHLCSCSSGVLRPRPAGLSAFLSPQPALAPARATTPFALAGGSASGLSGSLHIAPVSLEHLRGPSKTLAKPGSTTQRLREAQILAEYARVRFTQAFQNAEVRRLVVSDAPLETDFTLRLAIVELNKNTVVGSVGRLATRASGVPGLSVALNVSGATRPLKASIAIEGQIIDNATGKAVYQFADVAESKTALLPVTDFQAYGQARMALRDWARSLVKVVNAAPDARVRGAVRLSFY